MRWIFLGGLMLSLASGAWADASIPKADLPKTQDTSVVGRYSRSFIVSYEKREFDEVRLPLSPLKRTADRNRKDQHNNIWYEPERSKTVEGQRIHLVYLMPENVSALQVVRNYQNELHGKNAKTLFECKGSECGGDASRSSGGGGGEMSLSMFLWPEEAIKDKDFSNGKCAQTMRMSDQRYALMELPEGKAYVSVLAYTVKDGGNYCSAFNERTIAAVDVIERKAMEQKMVTIKAEEMAQAINTNGRVALYGLYFDTAKAEVKSESRDTLAQIAKLLGSTGQLKLLVVGHTDNVGGFASNMDLSKRRAESVVNALVNGYKVDRKRLTPVGVSFASPVATNQNEEGRAKNRRVELVPNN